MLARFILPCVFASLVIGSAQPASRTTVVNTWAQNGFANATRAAWQRLAAGSTALDAVEIGCSFCEKRQPFSGMECGCDGSVGLGGSPDENGETTLDAMIMDGDTMDVGAVASLRRISTAISVARAVMELTYHTFLAGDLATQFALKQGFVEEPLYTERSAEIWLDWLKSGKVPNYYKNKSTYSSTEHTTVGYDTIGMIAIDSKGSIACGTSTNGATHKIPGRVGDSPVMGAGTYCETGVGGAAATGDGDQMMRFLPSFAAVGYMRAGDSPTAACAKALQPIAKYYPAASGGLVCLNAQGEWGGAKLNYGSFPFTVRNGAMDDVQVITV